MLDLSQPVRLYDGVDRKRKRNDIYICEWRSFVHAKPEMRGIFLVEAGHVMETNQTAKKLLRDELVLCLSFEFTARLADPAELEQIAAAPAGTIIQAPPRQAALPKPG